VFVWILLEVFLVFFSTISVPYHIRLRFL